MFKYTILFSFVKDLKLSYGEATFFIELSAEEVLSRDLTYQLVEQSAAYLVNSLKISDSDVVVFFIKELLV